MAAVVASFFTVFITSDNGQLATYKSLANMGVGDVTPEPAPGVAQTAAPDYALGSGAIVELRTNEKIEIADPKRPNDAFNAFYTSICGQIGIGTGIPQELVMKHFGTSYTAARAAILEAWRFFRGRRKFLTSNVHAWAYESLIEEAVARRYLTAPGFFTDPIRRSAWLRASWRGPSPGQINPLDEVRAAEKRIDIQISTRERETAESSGEDWNETIATLGDEVELAGEVGVSPPGAVPAPIPVIEPGDPAAAGST